MSFGKTKVTNFVIMIYFCSSRPEHGMASQKNLRVSANAPVIVPFGEIDHPRRPLERKIPSFDLKLPDSFKNARPARDSSDPLSEKLYSFPRRSAASYP